MANKEGLTRQSRVCKKGESMKNSLRIASTLLVIILSACSLSNRVTYNHPTYPFQLDYPSDGSVVSETSNSVRIQLPFQPGTTLQKSYLDVFVNPGAVTCLSPYSDPYPPPGSMVTGTGILAGKHWVVERGVESTGDSTVEWIAYSTYYEVNCVSLTFVLRSNPLLILPPYDKDTEELGFKNIMDTFIWNKPTLPGVENDQPMIQDLPTRTSTPTTIPPDQLFPPTSTPQRYIPSPTPTPAHLIPPTPTPTPLRYVSPTPTPQRYVPSPTPTPLRHSP
jgi:hypothetical protein